MRKCNSTSNIDFNDNFQEKDQNKNAIYDNSISLLKHKVFLEKLLHLIKISQIDYLSQISSNSNKSNANTNNDTDTDTNTNNDSPKNKIKIIKNILSNLQKDLITTLKDNTNSKAKMQNETTNIKSSLIKSIFEASGHTESSNLDINNSLNETPKSIQRKNVSNYNESYYKYNIELPHLKLLNFKIENQLKYINSLIKVKMQSIKRLYIFCDNQNDIMDASNYLHQNLINARNDFKSMVKKKEIQNRNLLILNSQLNSMREEVMGKKSTNEYINTSEVINEDSMEYYTKTNVCTLENYKRNSKDFESENKINNIGFNNKVLIPKNNLFE